MTTEELLKPRYKVIADYPQSNINPFRVGDILTENGIHFTRLSNPKSLHQNIIDGYPHLFQKLEWHEERKPEDMPEYVKDSEDVFRVEYDFNKNSIFILFKEGGKAELTLRSFLSTVQPATKEEYEALQSLSTG